MLKLKLMTIVGTRPEIIKLSEIIKECDKHFEHILVHTGQNYDYELNQIFFNELGIREPDYYLNVPGVNLGDTLANIMRKSYDLIDTVKPQAILILGDTNSSLSAITAKRHKVPIFHLEAGNRCFDENLPEEINRKIVDHTSDVNLCYTEHARRNLISEGLSSERTLVVGSPMKQVIHFNLEKIHRSSVINRLGLSSKEYILLSAHREENIDDPQNFIELVHSINSLSEEFNVPVVYSVHPRSKNMIKKKNIIFSNNVVSLEPFSFTDYITLQQNALCVVSDSGTLAEESSILRFPAVSLRTSTERPEAIEKGNFIIGGIKKDEVIQSVRMAISNNNDRDFFTDVVDYSDINVSKKVVQIIQGYTMIVNRKVWRKNG